MSGARKSNTIAACQNILWAFSLIAVSIVGAFVLLETFTRFKFKDEVDHEVLQARIQSTTVSTFIRPSIISGLLYELIPNVNVKWQGVTVSTSGDSCRIKTSVMLPQISYDVPPLRVAMIGDSTPFGWRVEYEETYGEILRKKLEGLIHKPVIIKNFSVPGYNSLQHYIVFKEKVIPWKPDITILHYDHNDADPITFKPPSYLPADYGDNFLHSALIKLFLRRMRYVTNKQATTSKQTAGNHNEYFLENYRYSGAQYDEHLKHLFNISKLAKEYDIPVLCYIFNTFIKRQSDSTQDKNFMILHRPKAKELAKYGFFVVDSYAPIQQIFIEKKWDDLSPTWISKDDAHPNPEGHLLIAGILFSAINDSKILSKLIQR